MITPRTNAPSLENGQIFQEDVTAILSPNTYKHVDGVCVPKVDTLEDMNAIENLLAAIEKDYGVSKGAFKVIPQVEST